MKFDFPIKHIADNIILNDNGEVWAYFRITGFNYDFANESEKFSFFRSQLGGLENEQTDFHFLTIPNATDIKEILERTVKQVEFKEYALKEQGVALLREIMRELTDNRETSETTEYFDFVGVQLNREKIVHKEGNVGLSFLQSIKAYVDGINSPIYQAVGLKTSDILNSEIEGYKMQSKMYESVLSTMYSSKVAAVSFEELLRIVELNFSTRINNSDIKLRREFQISTLVEGRTEDGKKHKAFRPNKKHFLELQDVNIDESSPKHLTISRINNNNELENLYAQHVVISELPDVSVFPDAEWLYNIKTYLPFPITVSIRANRMPNSLVLKKLTNQKLEITDQKQEAVKGETRVDTSVLQAESGVESLESMFTRGGQPAYETSFVIRVTAQSEELLTQRVIALRDRLNRYGIKILSPYGEQLALFTEMFAGGKRINQDYSRIVEPKVLAGMMFGATTNIGDNRGFYIGETLTDKPVFIQPDLAAKSFEGMQTMVNSLAVLVAGMTGKGKSLFMNLFTYLSVLTGAKALVIDPKGDRKNWADGLPMIDKEFIRVWTLGSDEKDAGALDPFRTSVDIEEGKSIAKDILAFLTKISLNDYAYGVLTDGVEYAAEQKEPCIEYVLEYITEQKNSIRKDITEKAYGELEGFIQTLDSLKRDNLSRLLFGKVGQNYNTLSHDIPLQVLMIENLTLPSDKEVEKKALRPIHYISEAILISITAWTKEYMMKTDKRIYKIILQDEANVIKRNPIGEHLMDTINRQGRSFNTSLLQGAQNASDHKDNVSHIGMKFSFGLRKKEEAVEMLEFLNLPTNDANVQTILNLNQGNALFQDIYGRSAIIKINPVFKEIFDAFDTSTSTEEERKQEKEYSLQ